MRTVAVLLALLLAGACASANGQDASADVVELEVVDEHLREVATTRGEADASLATAVATVADVDDAVTPGPRAARADELLASVDELSTRLADIEPERLRDELRHLAATVDDARAVVRRAQEASSGWAAEYLAAQDEVLSAVREHAAAGDALAQLLDRHRPTYAAALEQLAELGDTHEDAPRSELVPEIEAVIDRSREGLEFAREELDTYHRRRDETASAVNGATADAAAVHDRRPRR